MSEETDNPIQLAAAVVAAVINDDMDSFNSLKASTDEWRLANIALAKVIDNALNSLIQTAGDGEYAAEIKQKFLRELSVEAAALRD